MDGVFIHKSIKDIIVKTTKLEITIIESSDPSIQCIAALRVVMDYFRTKPGKEGLSAMGNDYQAVLSWFQSRYPLK